MQLKVSQKAALEALDILIGEGKDLMSNRHILFLREETKKAEAWFDKAYSTLSAIFLDHAPEVIFQNSIVGRIRSDEDEFDVEVDLTAQIDRSLRTLVSFYKQLSAQSEPQTTAAFTASQKQIYVLKELQIDLGRRVLRNMTTNDKPKSLKSFNYIFIKTLIDAKGSLVTYIRIAEAVKDISVSLTEKEVMDKKGKFIKMLQDNLHISESTCDELIQVGGGYRISPKIYE